MELNEPSSLRLQVEEPIPHFFRLHDFPDFDQALDDSADSSLALTAIDDTGVGDTGCVDTQKILILGEDDPLFGQGECCLLLVGSTEEGRFRRSCDLDSAASQTLGDRVRAVFIQVEA